MTPSQTFRVAHYDLTCSAVTCDNGMFQPSLVITQNLWPRRPRTISMHRGLHPSADIAIASAHAQGLVWVQDFGERAMPA